MTVARLLSRVVRANRPEKLRVMARNHYRLLRTHLTGEPGLKTIDVAIGCRCNMQCAHGFAVSSLKRKAVRQLSLAQDRAIACEAADLGRLRVNLQGGEPGLTQCDIDASWARTDCSAAVEQVNLTPCGDIFPCPFIQISLGILHEETLGAIGRRAPEKGWFGGCAGRCRVAEDRSFAGALNNLYSRFEDLPVPFPSDEGRKLLDEHRGSQRSKGIRAESVFRRRGAGL